MLAIEIENEETWPSDVIDCFEKSFDLLTSYAARAREILFSPSNIREASFNEFQYKRGCVIEEVESMIKNHDVVAYHCTRLLNYETDDIIENGMKLPSLELLQSRLIKACDNGFLSLEQIGEIFTTNNYRDQPNRNGSIHFTCNKSTLKREGNVHKFFRCWGGEAVFNEYGDDAYREPPPVWTTLSSMGEACIIKIGIANNEIDRFAEKLESAYLENRNIDPAESSGCEPYLRYQIKSGQILGIIRFGDAEFLKLTDHLSWTNLIN